MGWSVLVALVTVGVAFGVVMAGRPATRRLAGAARAPEWLRNRTTQSVVVLAAGATVVVALAFVFLGIVDSVTENDDLTAIDRPIIEWVASHRADWLTTLVTALTNIGGKVGLTAVLTITAVGVAVRLRSWRPLVLAVVSGGGGAALVTVIKTLVARDRPDPLLRAVTEDGFSFPSGHATSSMVVLCTVAWLLTMVVRDRTAQATTWVAAVLLAVSIGLSRVYLGVHYPTDVLAGWVLAATWLITVAVAARMPGSPIVPWLVSARRRFSVGSGSTGGRRRP